MEDRLTRLYKAAMNLPMMPGVYKMKNRNDDIIYIGKAKRLKNRVSSYFKPGADHQPKVAKMVSLVDHFDVIVTDSEFEALVLECSLIKQHSPKYNILLKDDKGFSYIRVSNEEYPRITAELQKNDDDARYIGPYMSSFGVRRMVESAQLAFGLPTCNRKFPRDFGKGRPCLNAHIGRCMALCRGKISKEEYGKTVDAAVEMLTKGTDHILKLLQTQMEEASENLEFERAARLRDSINSIKKMADGQKIIHSETYQDTDIFGFAANEKSVCAAVLIFRNGKLEDKEEKIIKDTTDLNEARDEFIAHYYINKDKHQLPRRVLCDADFDSREALEQMLTEKAGRKVLVTIPQKGESLALINMAYKNTADRLRRDQQRKTRDEAALGELANLLGMKAPPERIEAYDISNYGDEKTAGMTVFVKGLPRRADYTRFKIKTVEGIDDYASMTEVILRRIGRFDSGDAHFANKPDLILLDGGAGHLAVISEAVKGTSFEDVPMFGMVKDSKHRTRGIVGQAGEIQVSMHKNAFAFVTSIQDETHRYAITFQRKTHSRGMTHSSLNDIEGIGPARAKALLKHFGTIREIREASVEELLKAKGMTRTSAEAVYNYYH
ncbi:MAG: excinuclease ABC subunit UvrC [Oscillospiraceae bacterium]|nr:excinuclease ABC subunit UvrC [Oscillospiraceae bacterium]